MILPLFILLFLIAFSQSQTSDVVIVGGGLSGLNAARHLKTLRGDVSILVLEGREEIGGRIRSVEMKTLNGSTTVDIGSQWIAPSHNELIQLINQYNLTLEEQTKCGEGGKIRMERVKRGSQLMSSLTFDQIKTAVELEKLARRTVKEWMEENKEDEEETQAAHRLLQTILDAPESTVSALQLQLMASSEGKSLHDMLAGMGNGEGMRMNGGMKQLIQKMSEGLDIRLNERVLSINENEKGEVEVKTTKGEYIAKRVIVTVPPWIISSIHLTPSLPSQLSSFLQSYRPVGDAFHFAITYNSPWWRANNVSGEVTYSSKKNNLRWMTTFDTGDSSECGSCAAFSGLIWGIAHFSVPTEIEKRKELILEAFVKTSGYLDATDDVLDYKDIQFSREELSGGSIGVLPTSSDLTFLQFINNTITHGNVIFASSELSTRSIGLMNGAVVSGEAAAREVNEQWEEGTKETHDGKPSQHDVLYNAATVSGEGSGEEEAPFHLLHSIPSKSEVPLSESNDEVTPPTLHHFNAITPFPYSTSTFYPPSTTPPLITSSSTQSPGPNDFHYSTSTQYPPSEGKTQENEEEGPAKLIHTLNQQQTPHKEEEKVEDEIVPFEVKGFEYKTDTQSTSTPVTGGFIYHTSTHYPVKNETVEEEEEGHAHMIMIKNQQMAMNEDNSNMTDQFHYSTSTQYPPETVAIQQSSTPFVHFSNGNTQEEKAEKEGQQFNVDATVQQMKNEQLSPSNVHVEKAKSAIETLEEEVAQIPKRESAGIGERLLELLRKIMRILKGE